VGKNPLGQLPGEKGAPEKRGGGYRSGCYLTRQDHRGGKGQKKGHTGKARGGEGFSVTPQLEGGDETKSEGGVSMSGWEMHLDCTNFDWSG